MARNLGERGHRVDLLVPHIPALHTHQLGPLSEVCQLDIPVGGRSVHAHVLSTRTDAAVRPLLLSMMVGKSCWIGSSFFPRRLRESVPAGSPEEDQVRLTVVEDTPATARLAGDAAKVAREAERRKDWSRRG